MTINVFGGGYNPLAPVFPVQRSVRLRSSASAYFNRTPATSGNRQIFTISFWLKRGTIGSIDLFRGNASTANGFLAAFLTNSLYLYDLGAGAGGFQIYSARVFRDPSAWYHIVIAFDTTQATDSNRVKVYINGVQENLATWTVGAGASRYPSLNANLDWNNTNQHQIGYAGNYGYFDGYIAEFNNVSGLQLDANSFGSINSTTGVWQPIKYSGTYGTNGFYLNFNDNSAATAAAIGKDSSGNGNNWTPNNISVTAGVTYDSMLDVPTLTSTTNANFCTLNPLYVGSSPTITNGNLYAQSASASYKSTIGTIQIPASGKWYFEASIISNNGTGNNQAAGITATSSGSYAFFLDCFATSTTSARKYVDGAASGSYGPVGNGTVIGVAVDADNGKAYLAVNNTWIDSSSPTGGTGGYSMTSGQQYAPFFQGYNSGQTAFNFGAGSGFTYTPPTGFKSLNTYNLPAPTIPNGAVQMNIVPSSVTGRSTTGGGTAKSITSLAFQPDLVMSKDRSQVTRWGFIDSVRGVNKTLASNLTDAEVTSQTDLLTAFTSNGFNVGTDAAGYGWNYNVGASTQDVYCYWAWKAGGTAVTNTSGSITSSVSANPSAGFSIVTFTTPASGNFTVGHGLGIAPAMVILKTRSGVDSWYVYNKNFATPTTGYLQLNSTAAIATSVSLWGSTNPTSSVVTLGTGGGIAAAATGLLYCFSEIAGYSKFGSYTGNGSADGPFVYTGFRPRFVMFKATTTSVDATWVIKDTSRNPSNVASANLYANQANAEDTASVANVDILSNGFKLRGTYNGINGSGQTYIYMAFAENPFSYSLAR